MELYQQILATPIFDRYWRHRVNHEAVYEFDEFVREVRALLDSAANGKGYNHTGVNGRNELFEFVYDLGLGYGHAMGEIIYKVKRFAAKGNPEDLTKAAAWAFLILRHHHERAAHHGKSLKAPAHEASDRTP